MKKIFLLFVIIPFIFFNISNQIKAQSKVEDRYYSPEWLDGIRNAKATMFKNKDYSIEIQKKLFDVFNSQNIYDGSRQVIVIVNYQFLINENGRIVKLIPVDKLPEDGSKWSGKNLIINPKETTDIITREMNKVEFKVGKKEGKPVKYCYTFTCALTAGPSVNKNKKQPKIIIDGTEFFKSLDKFPEPIKINKPEYPEAARKARIQGKVLVRTLVDEKGNVVYAKIAKGIGFGCDEAAVKAVKTTKFHPGILRGSPVKVEIIIPIYFGLIESPKVDLTVKSLEYTSNRYNPIILTLTNKIKLLGNTDSNFSVQVYINNQLIFADNVAQILPNGRENKYWIGGQPFKPGKYTYRVLIDPKNKLNDVNRKNNIVEGTFEVK